MNTSTTGAAPAASFDPACWLSRFESFGGAFALCCDTNLHLWIAPREHSNEELSQARQMIVALTEEQKQRIAEHLNPPPATPETSVIERTFQQWKDGYQAYNRRPIPDGEGEQAEDIRQIDALCELEEVIRAEVATTPHEVAAHLWIALKHTMTKRDEESAILREDLRWLSEHEERFRWDERMVLAALRSLKAMEA